MKKHKIIIGLTILSSISLHAQTFITSNLDEPLFTNNRLSEDIWIANSFRTGSEDTMLNSIVTRISNFDGGDEFVEIYSNSASNEPGIQYATFLDNPEDLGSNNQFRFTPNGDVSLSANTTYWMVFGGGVYDVDFTLSPAQTGNAEWDIGNSIETSGDGGSSWITQDTSAILFGVEVIPEPSEYAFAIGICLIAFATFRRIRISQTS